MPYDIKIQYILHKIRSLVLGSHNGFPNIYVTGCRDPNAPSYAPWSNSGQQWQVASQMILEQPQVGHEIPAWIFKGILF